MKNKKKSSNIFIFYTVCVLTMFSCREAQKCGVGAISNGKVEFYICDEMLNQDTIINGDSRWFEGSDLGEHVSDSWLGEFDTIVFHIPSGIKIIEARQSFVIIPSLWAKAEDDVVQYRDFYDLKVYCNDPRSLQLEDNILVNPLNIDENLTNELYFKSKKGISKSELLLSLQKQFNTEELNIKNTKLEKNFTATDKKQALLDFQFEKKTYEGYLFNYINWEKAPREQFELLAVERYLTLTIQNGTDKHKLTLIRKPIYGN